MTDTERARVTVGADGDVAVPERIGKLVDEHGDAIEFVTGGEGR